MGASGGLIIFVDLCGKCDIMSIFILVQRNQCKVTRNLLISMEPLYFTYGYGDVDYLVMKRC